MDNKELLQEITKDVQSANQRFKENGNIDTQAMKALFLQSYLYEEENENESGSKRS